MCHLWTEKLPQKESYQTVSIGEFISEILAIIYEGCGSWDFELGGRLEKD
jgi:hypothetical protein